MTQAQEEKMQRGGESPSSTELKPLAVEQRPDAPVHFLVTGVGDTEHFVDDAKAWGRALVRAEMTGHKTTVWRSVAEFLPVLKPVETAT